MPPLDEASSAVHVLVNDTQCASGVGPDERLLEPEVEVTAGAVTILFATKQLTRFQTCPNHPAATRVVPLPEALGSRQLLDGGVYPPQPPCALDQWGNLALIDEFRE